MAHGNMIFPAGVGFGIGNSGGDTVPETRQDLETCHVIGRDVGSSSSVGASDFSGDFARLNTDVVFMVGTVEAGGWRRFVA
jgi:hypothetical protein